MVWASWPSVELYRVWKKAKWVLMRDSPLRNGLNGIQLQRGSSAVVPEARSQPQPYLASPESLLDEVPLQTWSWKLEQWGPAVCFNKASGGCDASHHWSRYKEEHSGSEVFANAQGLSITLPC